MNRALATLLTVGTVAGCAERTPAHSHSFAFYLDSLRISRPTWQLPDSVAPDSLRRLVLGDVNGDGLVDRSLVLVKGDSGILLFFLAANSHLFYPPEILATTDDLRTDILVFNGPNLLFGPWASDNAFEWQWDSLHHEMKYVVHQNDSD